MGNSLDGVENIEGTLLNKICSDTENNTYILFCKCIATEIGNLSLIVHGPSSGFHEENSTK